jgi:predicted phage terminase large subunit-like protein
MATARITELIALEEAKRTLHLAATRLLPFAAYTHPDWQTAEHHRRICNLLERVERGEVKRAIVCMPPRSGKSELVSRRFPAWYLGRNPESEIISTAYGTELAVDEYGRKVRNIVRDPLFGNVFPDVTLADDSQAAGRWNTNHGGGYLATGVGAGITGRGAGLLIIDDPFKGRAEADSERERQLVWSWYDSEARTRLAPGGAIVIVATRWHEEDLIGMVLREHADQGWEVLTLPAIANEGTNDEQALWPERFPLEHLRQLRASYMRSHPREWYALYQQTPRSETGTYIKREWFEERYAKAPAANAYIVSDFAITEAKEGKDPDYTEHGVFGLGADDKLYVLDWWYGQTTTDVWVEELLRLIKKWKPLCWFGEGGVVGKAIEPIMLRMMREQRIYCRTERLSPIHDKATRGRAFQGRAHAGRVLFPAGQEWAERVINQCVAFPGGAHDDAFDVMAWMGLAIDQAHPAIVPAAEKPKPRHDYNRNRAPTHDSYKLV